MTTVENVTRVLPGTPEWDDLLASIAAGAKDRDLNDENPFDQVAALKRARLRKPARLPESLGGAGYTCAAAVLRGDRRGQGRSIVAHIFRTHFWFTEERLRSADDPVSRRWLDKIAEGKIFGNAFSEKGSLAVGSLVFDTRLLADGARIRAHSRLTGEKYYSTGTLFSELSTVDFATTDHDSGGQRPGAHRP